MRILHFIDTLGIGGAETLLKDTIAYYKKTFPEDEHFVMTLYRGGGYEDVIRENAVYFNLNFSKKTLLSKFFIYRRFLLDNKIDIVHSHLNESTIVARLFTPRSVKLVSTYHSGYLKHGAWNFSYKRLWAEKIGLKKTHYCLFVSNSVAADTIPSLGVKTNFEVLKNFYNPRFHNTYKYKDDDQLRLVAVGNLTRQKNHKLILEALKSVNNPTISLDIYGEGTLRNELQEYINQFGLNAQLKGRTFITSELLGGYDVYIMSSLNEGFGIALVEAMASGLPSILADVPSLKEVSGNSAVIFQNHSVESLCNVLSTILRNKEVLKEYSENALHLAENFSVEKNISRLNAVYQKLLTHSS